MEALNCAGRKPAFMTEAASAAYLSVSVTTLRRWRRNNTGPKCFKVGDIVRYTQENLDDWRAHPGFGDSPRCDSPPPFA